MYKKLVIEGEFISMDACKSQIKQKNSKRYFLKLIINGIALTSLIFAYIYGYFSVNSNYLDMLLPYIEGENVKQVSGKPLLFEIYNDREELISYCGIQKEIGYGGPLVVATEINLDGEIVNVFTLDHKETLSFFHKLNNHHFFDQFQGKKVTAPFIYHQDVDMVSGATISSIAFSNTIERTAHFAGKNFLGYHIPDKPFSWKFGWNETGLILLSIMAFVGLYKKNKILRSATLAISFFYLGFYLNSSLSVSTFGSILLGYFPAFESHLIWWILAGLSIGSVVFLKKNVYCSNMCPFHAAQKGLIYISGMKYKLPNRIQKVAKHTSKILLWASLILIFLSANPTLAAYEPFALLFSLDGIGVQWYILPAALVGSLFMSDFFCKYFCPVGRTFTYMIKARKSFDTLLVRLNFIN